MTPAKNSINDGAQLSLPQSRLVTTLFADIVDSTTLSQTLAIEELNSILQRFLKSCTSIVEEEYGYLARYMGDGVLAYFGYPVAKEKSAAHAVLAALKIRDFVESLNQSLSTPISVRVGISTGKVVVGETVGHGLSQEKTVVGETPNLAARLQSAAPPDHIYVCQKTASLSDMAIHYVPVQKLSLKGFDKKVEAFDALVERAIQPQHESNISSQKKFIGRIEEVRRLDSLKRKSLSGGGQILGIVGEAGIGKSTLIDHFVSQSQSTDECWLIASSYSLEIEKPFFVLEGLLQDLIQLEISTTVTSAKRNEQDLLEEKTTNLIEIFLDRFSDRKTVIVIEDYHWIDSASALFLARLIEHLSINPWLIICTSRNQLPIEFRSHPEFHDISLGGLTSEENRALIANATPNQLPDPLVSRIVEKSCGIPLFSYELAVWSSRLNVSDGVISVPDSLSDLLLARLDQLPTALPTLQVIALLGPDSELGLLSKILEIKPEFLSAQLEELVLLRLLHIENQAEDRCFVRFGHALLQSAAYDTLLDQTRSELHQKAAIEISGDAVSYDEDCASAIHWVRGGEISKGISRLVSHGGKKLENGNYFGAKAVFESALHFLSELQRSTKRDALSLEIHSALKNIYQTIFGYSAQQTVRAANEAEKLAEKLGLFERQFEQSMGVWMAQSSSGKFVGAKKTAHKVLSQALSSGNERFLSAARMAQITSHCRLAEFQQAEDAFNEGERYFETRQFRGLPGAIAQAYGNAAIVALFQNRILNARKRIAIVLNSARHSSSDYEKAFAKYMVSMVCVMIGLDEMALRIAKSAYSISVEKNYPQFVATSRIVLGRALASEESAEDGARKIREGLVLMDSASTSVGQSMYLCWLAEAELFQGHDREATIALDKAEKFNPEERFYRPEISRLQAVLHVREGAKNLAKAKISEARSRASEIESAWHLDRIIRTSVR